MEMPPDRAVRIAEQWILKLDQEHGINMYLEDAHGPSPQQQLQLQQKQQQPGGRGGGGGRSSGGRGWSGRSQGRIDSDGGEAKSRVFDNRFSVLREQILAGPHDKLLT
jgi:hypothetical protein